MTDTPKTSRRKAADLLSRRWLLKLSAGTVMGAALDAATAQGAVGSSSNLGQQGVEMALMFNDPMFERQGTATMAHTYYGGADLGECLATARRIKDGDAESWYQEWRATADRLYGLAEVSAIKGHSVSAREAYLRASNYYRASYVFLFGVPVDPRLIDAFDLEVSAFLKAAALFQPAIEAVEIPFEGTTLPGYFYRVDDSGAPRPTVIATNGYDSTIQQMHFGHAVAAVRRGYNCLLFDGPGQGRVLYKQGIHMRPDWETVVTPVVDYALMRPEVDQARLALVGWSFGGYLAPRAASSEHRLAALIADPGQWDLYEAMKGLINVLEEKSPAELSDGDLQPFVDRINADPGLRWSIVQRAYFVHGINSLKEYVQLAQDYKLSAVAEKIRCPTLVTWAENDPVAHYAETLYNALRSPKQLIRFYAAEGAGDHCEMMARSLYHQRMFDWLDEVLEYTPTQLHTSW